MKVLISLDGEAVLKELTVTPPARIPAALPHPGFVRCTVLPLTRNAKPILCAVGVDPDQLRPLLLEPADFDEFWKNTKKELSAIPADFKMHKIGSNKTFNYYQISCANLNGQRAYAFLSLPVDPSRKMPLYVRAPVGEGTCSEDMIEISVKEEMGFECARLIFQLPPYPPVKKDADRKTRQDKFLKEIGVEHYAFYGLNDRNKFYARTAVAGCLR
ncbi:MAG: acetylxylan esterase, partial [Lentisphaeria bacterium]|nr:acetylxylan esterase [Lentisphaeria bacterium]